jgi:hypothetical protein
MHSPLVGGEYKGDQVPLTGSVFPLLPTRPKFVVSNNVGSSRKSAIGQGRPSFHFTHHLPVY